MSTTTTVGEFRGAPKKEYKDESRFDVIYGVIQRRSGNYDSAGVQGSTGFFTQDFCNVSAAERLEHLHHATLRHSNTHGDADDQGHEHQ